MLNFCFADIYVTERLVLVENGDVCLTGCLTYMPFSHRGIAATMTLLSLCLFTLKQRCHNAASLCCFRQQAHKSTIKRGMPSNAAASESVTFFHA